MREWLSGGASPCQGEGRGFDPRLALLFISAETLVDKEFPLFFCSKSIASCRPSFRSLNKEFIVLPAFPVHSGFVFERFYRFL